MTSYALIAKIIKYSHKTMWLVFKIPKYSHKIIKHHGWFLTFLNIVINAATGF